MFNSQTKTPKAVIWTWLMPKTQLLPEVVTWSFQTMTHTSQNKTAAWTFTTHKTPASTTHICKTQHEKSAKVMQRETTTTSVQQYKKRVNGKPKTHERTYKAILYKCNKLQHQSTTPTPKQKGNVKRVQFKSCNAKWKLKIEMQLTTTWNATKDRNGSQHSEMRATKLRLEPNVQQQAMSCSGKLKRKRKRD